MKKNLVVQLWGIGNLVQTEPLMRYLGEGDILVNPERSTHELAPLFPKWNFCTGTNDLDPVYDCTYVCGPWLASSTFQQISKEVRTPSWTFQGKWDMTESEALLRMSDPGLGVYCSGITPELNLLTTRKNNFLVVSNGYNRKEGKAWKFKQWDFQKMIEALNLIHSRGQKTYHLGDGWDQGDWVAIRSNVKSPDMMTISGAPLIEQVKVVGGSRGYLGSDTGWGHIAGAYRLPSAIYTRTDPVKNRTGADILWQFNDEASPERVAEWILKEANHGKAFTSDQEEGQEDAGGEEETV